MKNKFFTEKSRIVLCASFSIFYVIYLMVACFIDRPIGRELDLYFFGLFFGIGLIFLLTFKDFGRVAFEEERFIYKPTPLHRKRIYKYEDIEKLVFDFYCGGAGLYHRRDPSVYVFFKKRKKSDFSAEISLGIVHNMLTHKPENCKIKIEYESINVFCFSEKYRKVLWEYLTVKQKEDIEERLRKKAQKKRRKVKR